jgi:hypothetical protein
MCLGDDSAVNTAVDKMLEENVEGKLIVDCSTVHPETTNALEKKITDKGGEFVGMPGKLRLLLYKYLLKTDLTTCQCSAPRPWQTTASLSA